MKRLEDHKIHDKRYFEAKNDIYLKEEDLGGQNRYVADGFLNSTECESMMQFATVCIIKNFYFTLQSLYLY